MTIKSMPNFSQSSKAILKAARALICLFAVNLAGLSGASMSVWADDRLADKAAIGSNNISLNQASVKALHPDERIICQDLSQCADILSRHDAQGFDYQLLAEAFQNYGDEGALQLLQIAAGKDLPMALRSYEILTRPNWRYNLEFQNRVIKRWQAFSGEQGNQQEGSSTRLAAHRALMQTIASLPMREHFIAGLNHRRGDIADQSRLGLENLPPAILSAPIPPRLRAPLLKAATTQAAPEILGLITALPKTQTRPIFLQNLRSDDAALIEAAFAGLSRPELNSAQDPDNVSDTVISVLKNMFQTAPDVVDSKTQAHIFALSHFLQARHRHDLGHNQGHDLAAGGDGQYLRFAHTVLGDDTMPAAAHMAALDAILLSAPIKGKTLPDNKLPDNEIVITALQNLLNYRSMPVLYYVKDLHKKLSPQHHAQFLLLFWQNINLRDAEGHGTSVTANDPALYVDDRAAIMRQAARHPPSQESAAAYNSLLEQGLSYGRAKDQKRNYAMDWRVPYYAAIAVMRFSGAGLPDADFPDTGFKAKLEQLADRHEIIGVQAVAQLALKPSSVTTGNFNPKALAQIQEGLLKDAKPCPVKVYDFSDQTIQMPYFDRGFLPGLPDISPPLLKPLNQVLPQKNRDLRKSTAKPEARAALRYGLRAAQPVHLRSKLGADNGQNRADMRNGWLAGYNFTDHDHSHAKRDSLKKDGLKKDSLKKNAPDTLGGLIFYDNKSGDSEAILPGNILAIIPKRANQPSDMTQSFWVIITRATAAERFSAKAAANIAEIEISHKSIEVQFQGRLPAIPTAINYLPEQAVAETHSGIKAEHQIEFGFDTHPALKFDAKSGFRRLCSDG